mmetsp:Transcript_26966/g.32808  ORF Transcript_26966/g.32808 Transcript_26966/m.32808 type:complete len:147 (+) Transcript_26966:48-488(+)
MGCCCFCCNNKLSDIKTFVAFDLGVYIDDIKFVKQYNGGYGYTIFVFEIYNKIYRFEKNGKTIKRFIFEPPIYKIINTENDALLNSDGKNTTHECAKRAAFDFDIQLNNIKLIKHVNDEFIFNINGEYYYYKKDGHRYIPGNHTIT